MNKELINKAVAESINMVAKHYNTTPDMVRLAIANGDEKIKGYVAKMTKEALLAL